MKVIVAATVLVAAQLPVAVPASGQGLQLQQPSSPFLGGVPTGDPSPEVLALSLADAIRRGLATTWAWRWPSRVSGPHGASGATRSATCCPS
jgi:hypothetical protein